MKEKYWSEKEMGHYTLIQKLLKEVQNGKEICSR